MDVLLRWPFLVACAEGLFPCNNGSHLHWCWAAVHMCWPLHSCYSSATLSTRLCFVSLTNMSLLFSSFSKSTTSLLLISVEALTNSLLTSFSSDGSSLQHLLCWPQWSQSMFVIHFLLIECCNAQILVRLLGSDTLESVGPGGMESGILRGHSCYWVQYHRTNLLHFMSSIKKTFFSSSFHGIELQALSLQGRESVTYSKVVNSRLSCPHNVLQYRCIKLN